MPLWLGFNTHGHTRAPYDYNATRDVNGTTRLYWMDGSELSYVPAGSTGASKDAMAAAAAARGAPGQGCLSSNLITASGQTRWSLKDCATLQGVLCSSERFNSA